MGSAKQNGSAGQVTDLQVRWVRAIAAYIDKQGYAPTYEHLQHVMRGRGQPPLARHAAAAMVRRLKARGLVQHDAGVYRSLRVTAAGRALIAGPR